MLTLTSILSTPESSYLEGKSAKGGFPDSFWESYSAFANCRFGERAGSGLNGIVYVWKKVYHTEPEIFVKEEYDRTFLKLPTLGKEPDVEAMAEFYPDEEEETNDPVNENVTANVRVNDTLNGNDPINIRVNDPINKNDTVNVRVNDPINENDPENVRVNGTLNGNDPINVRVNDPITENDTVINRLIFALRDNPNISAPQLAENLNKSERHIRRILSKLQSDGKIRRIGADKNGHWEVINNQSDK